MRYSFLSVFIITLFACSAVSSPPDNDIPRTFEENKSKTEIKSFDSRYGGSYDVVNSMYNEIVDDDANLKSLEKDIRNISGTVSDASNAFNGFNNNNTNYYNSASNHANSIKDNELREKIRVMVEASKSQYLKSIGKHNGLLNDINPKQATLSDLHTYLKLVKTLPAIEAYQKKNLPSTTALENASAEIDKVIKKQKMQLNNNH